MIAEKLQAAGVLYEVNSRYKDFYDIQRLAAGQTFQAKDLYRAIEATFTRRGTLMSDAHRLFAPTFTGDSGRQAQWSAFLKRIRHASSESFPSLMEDIRDFIEPILNGTATGSWNPTEGTWSKDEST